MRYLQERAKNTIIVSEEKRVGVDVARSGNDSTVFVFRQGPMVKDVREHRNINTMEIVGRLIHFVEKHQVPWINVLVDEIGIGAGVVDRLKEQGRRVSGVNFGVVALDKDKYRNIRAECYWKLREALSPSGVRIWQDAVSCLAYVSSCQKFLKKHCRKIVVSVKLTVWPFLIEDI